MNSEMTRVLVPRHASTRRDVDALFIAVTLRSIEPADTRLPLTPRRAAVSGAGLAERAVCVTVALRVGHIDAQGVAAAVDRATEGVAKLTAILAVEARADLEACAVDALVPGAAAGPVAKDGARPVAAALPAGAGGPAGSAVGWVSLEIGAHPTATRLPAGAVAAGERAATAITDHATLVRLATGLRRAAVALVADLVAIAGVVADSAVLRVVLAVGALITAADQTLSAALLNTADQVARAARHPTAGVPGRATVAIAADLANGAEGPARPAGHPTALPALCVAGLAG